MMTGKKVYRTSVTLDDVEKQLLEQVSKRYKTSKCEVIRHAIHNTFEKEIKKIQNKKTRKKPGKYTE